MWYISFIGIGVMIVFIIISNLVYKERDRIKKEAYGAAIKEVSANLNSLAYWFNGYPSLDVSKKLLRMYSDKLQRLGHTPCDFDDIRNELLKMSVSNEQQKG